jgi:hypothetical protein
MKSINLICFLVAIVQSSAYSQIPNDQFEEWQTIDTIEQPVAWTTNNFYVQKVEDAIEGNYSLKISSTARDLNGFATWPGCAHVKFLPTQTYQYMTASVRIDSVKEGRIEIRVKQRNANGFYEKIGGWVRNTVTVGAKDIWFPLEQMQLDTLLIEVWAFNKDTPLWETNTTYSSGILDNLALTNTVASKDHFGIARISWELSPNPTKDKLRIVLNEPIFEPCKLRLLNLRGQACQIHNFQNLSETTLDLQALRSGVYILEIISSEQVLQRDKIVLMK